MQYSILGPFSRGDAEYLHLFPATHDPFFGYKTSLELAGIEAFFSQSGKTEKSNSHHGSGIMLTVVFGGRHAVLCETLKPFCAYYVGTTEQIKTLKTGFELRFREELQHMGVDMNERFRSGMDKKEVTEHLEYLFDSDDYYGNWHIKKALSHIGITYLREYVDTREVDEEEVARRIEGIRAKRDEYIPLVRR